MKRIMVLCLVMALLATMTIGVSATTTPVTPDEDGKYEVTINVGAENKGAMYGFVAIPGTVISEDTIVYIDQATADAEGNVTFTGFAPKDTYTVDGEAVAWETCNLYIGGAGLEGATLKGTLAKAATAPTKYAITGTVLDDDITDNLATVTVYAADGDDEGSDPDVVGTATATATGDYAFSIEVVPGTYSVKFVKDSYLKLTYTGVSVVDQAVSLNGTSTGIDMKALAGDITNNDVVNISDLKPVLDNFNKEGAAIADKTADLTSNDVVNISDLKPVLDAFNKESIVQPFAQ